MMWLKTNTIHSYQTQSKEAADGAVQALARQKLSLWTLDMSVTSYRQGTEGGWPVSQGCICQCNSNSAPRSICPIGSGCSCSVTVLHWVDAVQSLHQSHAEWIVDEIHVFLERSIGRAFQDPASTMWHQWSTLVLPFGGKRGFCFYVLPPPKMACGPPYLSATRRGSL